METSLTGDIAILRAWKVDTAGNCVFRYATKAFGPLMAKAAKLTIVEAENIVEAGEIDPNDVDLPGIFVDRIVPSTEEKKIEILKLREEESGVKGEKGAAQVRRERIARRAAKELKQGYYVNLGVGKWFDRDVECGLLTSIRYSDPRCFIPASGPKSLDSV